MLVLLFFVFSWFCKCDSFVLPPGFCRQTHSGGFLRTEIYTAVAECAVIFLNDPSAADFKIVHRTAFYTQAALCTAFAGVKRAAGFFFYLWKKEILCLP